MHPESGSDMSTLMEKANSPAGKQLLEMVNNTENTKLQAAMEKAAAGDLSYAAKILQELLASPEAAALVKELRGD